MGASGTSVATAFIFQICFSLVVFFLFTFLRNRGFARRFYAPKRYDPTVEYKPRRLSLGLFGWMTGTFTYPEQEVIKVAGLDAAMYIRMLRFGWSTFFKVTLLTCIILLPIHLTGHEVNTLLAQQAADEAAQAAQDAAASAGRRLLQASPSPAVNATAVNATASLPIPTCAPAPPSIEAKKYDFSEFDKCSLANIASRSPRMWAHVVLVYIITYIILSSLSTYNAEATVLRLAYLANLPRGGPSHTVLITDIPGMRHGTFVWRLRQAASSTAFAILPEGLRNRILDHIEYGIDTLGGVVSMDMAKQTEPGVEMTQPTYLPSKPERPDAIAKAAEANTRAAEEAEKAKSKQASGVTRRRKTAPGSEIKPTDQALNPWHQASEVLGDRENPRADMVEHFIQQEVEGTYGRGLVAAVNPVWDQGELNPLINEYEKIKQQLEDYLDKCTYDLRRKKPIKKRQRVTVVGPSMGQWGIQKYGVKPTKVDAIDFWCTRLEYLSQTIPQVQQRCHTRAIPAAFVTVNTRAAQVTMSTTLHHHDETTWQVQPAPEPKEIIWGNLAMRRWERSLRTLILWIAYLALLCFYIIPIAAVQALIQVPTVTSLPVIGTIVNLPVIKQLIEAVLPGLVLMIFLALLPALLAFMCRLSGFVSVSQVDFGVVTRYFYFQVVTLFLGSLISGSLLNQIQQFVNNPSSIISILGAAIPMTATFFVTYILVAGVGKSGINHLRIVGYIIFWIKSKMAATPRARARLWSDQYTSYGSTLPDYTVAFLIGLVYCCVNPIIAPTVLIYYSFSIISDKYNQIYVYKREYESGGRLWYSIFNQIMVGLYAMQIVMLILLLVKKFPYALLLLPAPLITLVYHVFTLGLYSRPWSVMSAHDAAMLDRIDQAQGLGTQVTAEEARLIEEMYLSPAFKWRQEEVADLVREADIVSRRINGEDLADIEADLEEKEYQSAEEDQVPVPVKGATGSGGGLRSAGQTARGKGVVTLARGADANGGHVVAVQYGDETSPWAAMRRPATTVDTGDVKLQLK